MLDDNDNENLVKAIQAVDLLSQDLNALVRSQNPLLAEMALEIVALGSEVERRLKRIHSITNQEEKI